MIRTSSKFRQFPRALAVASLSSILLLAACGGGSSGDEESDTDVVKNQPLNQCVSVMTGSRPADTPEVRERMRQAQKECLDKMRATATTVKRR